MFKSLILIIIILAIVGASKSQNYTNEDNQYGITWMYFPDGDGNLHIINLTVDNSNSRGLFGNNNNNNNNVDVNDHVRFLLYTRKSDRTPKVLQLNKRRKKSADDFLNSYRKDLPTYVLIHGWISGPNNAFAQSYKYDYLKAKECNVIVVDWSDLAGNRMYPVPARQTRDVGRNIAAFIDHLVVEERVADISQFHLIGISLGAHVAGFTGNYVKCGRIPRITGLDPARPTFEPGTDKSGHLDSSDAEFVDIIHTCGGSFGIVSPCGHVDFYVNGGNSPQPGCAGLFREMIDMCSHRRSIKYFSETIGRKGFTAYRCHSHRAFRSGRCSDKQGIQMGDSVPITARGVYYLNTNAASPFGI